MQRRDPRVADPPLRQAGRVASFARFLDLVGLALVTVLLTALPSLGQVRGTESLERDGPLVRPAALPLLTRSADPSGFGLSETSTMISAWSFVAGGPGTSQSQISDAPHISGSLGRWNGYWAIDTHYFATLSLPPGAVIDYIGINTTTDTDSIMGLALWKRDFSTPVLLEGFSIPAHGWQTDYVGPLNILVDTNADQEFLLDVEQAPASGPEFWAWVEIFWHRTVSPPPGAATFNDVPTSHPYFQYIEALRASGITGGCQASPPLYCPDNPVTRGQMAVFLAKALGLNWPN